MKSNKKTYKKLKQKPTSMRNQKPVSVSTIDGLVIPAVYEDWTAEDGNRQRRCMSAHSQRRQ